MLAAVLSAGCGDDEPVREVNYLPDPRHAAAVDRDPFKLTCSDVRGRTTAPSPESSKLVIRAEFALAQVPDLRRVVRRLTLNRTGRSVYYGLTEVCKGRPGSFRPARLAVDGVRTGLYRAARNRPG
jgi:hypothetical protein